MKGKNKIMGKIIDLVGMVFSRLTVIKYYGNNSLGDAFWECVCSCGNENPVIVKGGSLRTGHTKSCGCIQKEFASSNIGARKKNTYNTSFLSLTQETDSTCIG